ncbi:uncharacterized protein LOC110467512 isoform X2 [Mizuhopecten yessoensis]|nr:uncharacterized protein LOC110467512 isoform X2 [Mizuhopecten yessoensis]XP_021380400.1 uncharacterized protein LOC110467512 isoform X2 [Mizuhopecten yessoensis]XP_021380402.1 uncharacterized protein LOC110467512 isoform X2 [Mizuhopecten yessoensis]XP_021380403.1 uncharacterized protein LOC110467512 isoform X2 [Mizuhopecten yessoensis]
MAVSYRKQIIYRKLCFVLCLFGFVLDLVGFLLPTWVSYIIGGYRHYYGLFSTCIVQGGKQACGTVDPDFANGTFKAGQAFGILGLITYFSSLVCCCIVFCWPRPWKRRLMYSASASALATALFTMLSLVLFFTSHPDHGSRLDFGYYIAVAACAISPFIAIFAFYVAKITSFPPKQQPTIVSQPLSIIALDSVSMTSSGSFESDNRSRSWDVPIILRELTDDNLHQVPPEFRSYTREETKAGPSFFFNHRPSEEVMQKVKLRNAQNQKQPSPSGSQHCLFAQNQKQPSPSGSQHGLDAQNQKQPSPSVSQYGLHTGDQLKPSFTGSQYSLNSQNQLQPSPSGSQYGLNLSVNHLGMEVDTYRSPTPVEQVESASSSV